MRSLQSPRCSQPCAAARTACSRRLVVRCEARRSGSSDRSPEILTAFFYGRAFAITLNRRLSEALIDIVSDASKALAERPQRLADFQEEVAALARKEMSGSGFYLTDGSGGSGSGSGAGGSGRPDDVAAAAAARDPQAAVDELRAEIAYARASLNEIRAAQRAAASQN